MESLLNKETLSRVLRQLLVNGSWATMTFYTRLEMLWNRAYQYYLDNYAEDIEYVEYPFRLINQGDHCQVYYPNIEPANFRFVQVEVEFEGQKYEVETNPYMVVGNRLFQRDFVQWLMNTVHDIDIDDEEEYIVHIMDHNINIVTVSDKEYIEIDSDNYLKKSLLD